MKEPSNEQVDVINQVGKIYEFFSDFKKATKLIPEVRTNISCSLRDAKSKQDIAAIEGRITVVDNSPYACGEVKLGASDHTARLILTAKQFDKSINCVMNLKYDPKFIQELQLKSDLYLLEIEREKQPEDVKKSEQSTMQWLIKQSVEKYGKIPDIIWDKGAVGKEPMMRLFAQNSDKMINKLSMIFSLLF
jgi:hydroxymethylpyrimidine/phosphomethylpyrimidine kinase